MTVASPGRRSGYCDSQGNWVYDAACRKRCSTCILCQLSRWEPFSIWTIVIDFHLDKIRWAYCIGIIARGTATQRKLSERFSFVFHLPVITCLIVSERFSFFSTSTSLAMRSKYLSTVTI